MPHNFIVQHRHQRQGRNKSVAVSEVVNEDGFFGLAKSEKIDFVDGRDIGGCSGLMIMSITVKIYIIGPIQ